MLIILLANSIFSFAHSHEYEFVLNTDRWVSVGRGKYFLGGKLDADGDFTELSRLSDFSSGARQYIFINPGSLKPHPVYEYRSGTLILGKQACCGKFIPDAGSKVILFREYQYSPTAIRIWNLPGYFRLKNIGEAAKP